MVGVMDAKKLASIFDNPLTAKFARSLKHADLPKGWQDNEEIVRLAQDEWKNYGADSIFFQAFKGDADAKKLWHGTRSEAPFDEFTDVDENFPGFWFSSGRDLAEQYGDPSQYYVKLANTFEAPSSLPEMNGSTFETPAHWVDTIKEERGVDLKKAFDEERPQYHDFDIETQDFFTRPVLNELAANGYDSLSIVESGADTYAAFSPSQIKSVKNRGTFDPSDPNIYRTALPLAGIGGLMSALAPNEAEAAHRIRAMDAPIEEAWNPIEAFAGGIPGGLKSALVGVLPDGAMDWGMNKLGGLMSGWK